MFASLRQGEVLLRLALCGLAAVILWAVTHAWAPPQPYRTGYRPERDIVARVDFEQVDNPATVEARRRAASLALAVYKNDQTKLAQLRAALENTLVQLAGSKSLEEFGEENWAAFEAPREPGVAPPPTSERQEQFTQLRDALDAEGVLADVKQTISEAFVPLEQHGTLKELPPDHKGNQEKIYVYPTGKTDLEEVNVADVLEASAAAALQKQLVTNLPSPVMADRVFNWIRPQLPITLQRDVERTQKQLEQVIAAVPEQKKAYPKGTVLFSISDNQEIGIDKQSLELLQLEHQAMLAQRSKWANINRSLAFFGMFVAIYTLCGFYIQLREPSILRSIPRFFALLSLVVLTVTFCQITSRDQWRAELIPFLLFGMTIALAYHQELALLLSTAVGLIVVFSLGQGLAEMVIITAAVAAAILMLRNVRSRSKLLYVGIGSAAVTIATTLGVGTLTGQFSMELVYNALLFGLWAVIAGSLMTCLLPFIERMFDVQTDISLIELGDPAHPLLQELVRRAPGTYNHSITVASLAEAAAEAIGARALLVRVGAYFHDIGKMLKPGYFVENQGQGDNRHESLVPAMSTLVIIAHVKDGADLARQHHLPDSIIDFIQQHHGTTLVEYFYRRASEQSEAEGGDVDESAFRYPGPKPQTRETGILMLADAVESASRVLVEPTPARIESLVRDLAMKRLLDGQFDECGLTLREVHMIQESLVKSLTAVYHGRVKYPGQRTA